MPAPRRGCVGPEGYRADIPGRGRTGADPRRKPAASYAPLHRAMVHADTASKADVSRNAMIRRHSKVRLLPYPEGKTFAFTIIDDTDMATLEVVRPIYDHLFSLGLRTTKTVWVTRPERPAAKAADTGDTLERKDYAAYVR